MAFRTDRRNRGVRRFLSQRPVGTAVAPAGTESIAQVMPTAVATLLKALSARAGMRRPLAYFVRQLNRATGTGLVIRDDLQSLAALAAAPWPELVPVFQKIAMESSEAAAAIALAGLRNINTDAARAALTEVAENHPSANIRTSAAINLAQMQR